MRSFGVFDCHSRPGLLRAASTARSTSSAVPRGTSAITSPVAGFEHLHRLARRRVDELAADELLLLGHRHAHVRPPFAEIARSVSRVAVRATTGVVRVEPARRADSRRRNRRCRLRVRADRARGARSSSTARSPTTTRRGRRRSSAALDDGRFSAHGVDASSKEAVVALIRETNADAVLNAVDPLFNVPIFDACFEAGVTYLDMAMTLSEPHPTQPVRGGRRQARRLPVRARRGVGGEGAAGARRHRRSSPAPRTSSRGTPPTSSSPRSTRSASATARTSSSRATTSPPPSRSGRRSRSA